MNVSGALFKRRAMPDSKTRLDMDWLDMGTSSLARAPAGVRQAIARMIRRDAALLERFNRYQPEYYLTHE